MAKYRVLLVNDIRHILKDPMLMASLLGPLAIIALARFVFPLLSEWMEQGYAFSLSAYTDFTVIFLLSLIPLLPGTMAGLLMLDERDENIIAYYAVTPLARNGYLNYRLFLPSLLSLLLITLFFALSGMSKIQVESGYTLILLALEAPCIALFLAAFSSNKVEGLALSKVNGLLLAGPIVVMFVPEPWHFLGMWVPTYWPAKCYMAGISNEPLTSLGLFGVGLVFHVVLLMGLIRIFLKRID
jgi:fluoroquinolone transport system permease protein